MPNSKNDNYAYEMGRAYRLVEFLLKDLEQIQGLESSDRSSDFDTSTIQSLFEDVKSLMSFLRSVDEISIDDHPFVGALLIDIASVVNQQLHAVDSYLQNDNRKNRGTFQRDTGLEHYPGRAFGRDTGLKCFPMIQFKSVPNGSSTYPILPILDVHLRSRFTTDDRLPVTAIFLQHSQKIADLVQEVKFAEERILFGFYGTNDRFALHMARAYRLVEFLLEDLEQILGLESSDSSSDFDRLTIQSLFEGVKSLMSFLKRVQETSIDDHPVVADLLIDITSVVDQQLDAVDSYLQNGNRKNRGAFQRDTGLDDHSRSRFMTDDRLPGTASFLQHSQKIGDLVQRVKSAEERILVGFYDTNDSDKGGNSSVEILLTQNACSVLEEKAVVGLNDEVRELLHKLTRERKQLEVICVTGMGGIGKTTLAYRLYDDPSVVNHFHLRAWTSVSQICAKRTLFHNILSSILNENDPIFATSDEDMGEKLRKCLKGNRYLLVIDDIWDIEAWNEIKMYFPEDNNCSRILMTTRIKDVALKVSSSSSPPHCLRFLTPDESWYLFKQKVFVAKSFPEELIELGKQIVANCKGLPLAIVVTAGLLAKEVKTKEMWWKLAKNIGSCISNGSEKFMDILALSYEHLPFSLKSCFLYVGSFPEDYEIPAKRLTRSWIAEGFVQETVEKRLEDVAEDHLINLINRNLVIAVKKKPDGGIKSCHMHDMLRDLCHRNTKEKKFVQPICNCRRNGARTFPRCGYFHNYDLHFINESIVFKNATYSMLYKLLRTLDMRHINLSSFPQMAVKLLHLKYLALRIDCIAQLPPSIFELWRLETFILDGDKGERVILTVDILKMLNLRHLQISQELVVEDLWKFSSEDMHRNTHESVEKKMAILPTLLVNLQTISQLCPSDSVRNLLERTPNLRKLGFHLTLSQSNEPFSFPDLSSLNQLEALKFEYQTLGMMTLSIPQPKMFPPSLKKMTLIGSHVNWKEMSIIGSLPNLEVLKIKDNFFSGPLWETIDEGFRSLKFLKLSHMDLQNWISSSCHFPSLEWLVINGCLDLDVIPSEMGEVPTLQKIEVYRSSDSAVESARQIQESQRCFGNDDFNVFTYQHFLEF